MSFDVDAVALHEAIAVRQGEIGEREVRLGQVAAGLATNELLGQDVILQRAARFKAKAFGHIGIIVADTVELVLNEQSGYGPFGLLKNDQGTMRNAEETDVRTLSQLTACWENTLTDAARRALAEPADDGRRANLAAAGGHWALRQRAFGVDDFDLLDHMKGGCVTAATHCMIAAYGMRQYRKLRDPARELGPDLRKSHSPVISAAGLLGSQLHAYSFQYGGLREDRKNGRSWTNFSRIDPHIYTEYGVGTLVLMKAIENMPLKGYGTVGDVPPGMPGPRIGCPILFTPKLIQRLWASYVDSLVTAQLL